jgi:hypothetical protein
MPWIDGLLKLVTYPADTLPWRFGRRIRRARMLLRRTLKTSSQITIL